MLNSGRPPELEFTEGFEIVLDGTRIPLVGLIYSTATHGVPLFRLRGVVVHSFGQPDSQLNFRAAAGH